MEELIRGGECEDWNAYTVGNIVDLNATNSSTTLMEGEQ